MNITGLKIKEVRRMTVAEAEVEGWDIEDQIAAVIILEDGTKLYAARDDEGNGIGVLVGVDKKGETFYLT